MAARRRLPRLFADYIDGGSYAEATLRANVADLGRIRLRQQVLCDVSELDTRATLFGEALSLPVVLGPVALAGMFARRGEVQAARAADRTGTAFTLSTVSICSVEEVAAGTRRAPWLQLYLLKDRGFMAALLERALAVGVRALVCTVDVPMPGTRYRDARAGFAASPSATQRIKRVFDALCHPAWYVDVGIRGRPHDLGNVSPALADQADTNGFWTWVGRNFDPSSTWDDLQWVRERWPGALVIKGVMDPQDAAKAVDAGADGVLISNHGGRQLDGVSSTIAALPAAVDAIHGRVPVLMDGGVRSGLDVAKAIALGADSVLVGRAWAWALAVRGEEGIVDMLEMLKAELKIAMALTGSTNLAELRGAALPTKNV